MRPIKFRAWDKLGEADGCDVFNLAELMSGKWRHSRYENWGQFIGLKDKNGVEIYEGDIIIPWTENYDKPDGVVYTSGREKWRDDWWNNDKFKDWKQEIKYLALRSQYSGFFAVTIAGDFKGSITQIPGDCVVIGNIYEMPDLKEEQQ